jgi:SAM-dependent methyltransferase
LRSILPPTRPLGGVVDKQGLEREKAALQQQHGGWTAHNIRLADGVYTIGPGHSGSEDAVKRVTQIVTDLAQVPLSELRVLDLGALEGQYGLELAQRGADVLAIEGREPSVRKCEFAKRALGLDNIEFELGDVRALTKDSHGEFDVVLCLGLLYHLDAADVFPFLRSIAEMCTSLLVLETRVSLSPRETHRFEGREYHGSSYAEPDTSAARTDTETLWASLDNPRSFMFTRPSLFNVLRHLGFTSAYECSIPAQTRLWPDRGTFVAVRGEPLELSSADDFDAPDLPEERSHTLYRLLQNRYPRVLRRVMPRRVRDRVKRILT